MGIPIPKECPTCGSEVEIVGPKMFCRNKECPAQSFGKIKKFLKIVGVLGIGDGILGSIVDTYDVSDPSKLLKVLSNDEPNALSHLSMIKMGAVSLGLSRATKIRKEIAKLSEGVDLDVFIASLQIPFLGRSNSKRVADRCGSLETFLRLNTNELLSVDKIGYEMSDAILVGINQNRELSVRLLQHMPIKIKIEEPPKEDDDTAVPVEKQRLGGASFCISGTLSQPKSIYYDKIVELGGEAHKDIKSDTTYLVVDDSGVETNKVKKAKKHGANIIQEDDLKRILGLT